MSFDDEIDAIKQDIRDQRFFRSLGPAMGLAPKPRKGATRAMLEGFVTYFTPFGLIAMAIWPDAFID